MARIKMRTAINLSEMRPFTFKMKIATLFAGFTLVLQVLGVVTSSWVRVTDDAYVAVFGLWQGCVQLTGNVNFTCLDYSDLMTAEWRDSCKASVDNNDTVILVDMCQVTQTLERPPWQPGLFLLIRIMETVGLGGVVLTMFLTLLSLIYADFRHKRMAATLITVSFLTAGIVFTGGILVIKCTDDQPMGVEAQPSWSLDVSMLSAVVAVITGSVVIIDLKEESCLNMYDEENC